MPYIFGFFFSKVSIIELFPELYEPDYAIIDTLCKRIEELIDVRNM